MTIEPVQVPNSKPSAPSIISSDDHDSSVIPGATNCQAEVVTTSIKELRLKGSAFLRTHASKHGITNASRKLTTAVITDLTRHYVTVHKVSMKQDDNNAQMQQQQQQQQLQQLQQQQAQSTSALRSNEDVVRMLFSTSPPQIPTASTAAAPTGSGGGGSRLAPQKSPPPSSTTVVTQKIVPGTAGTIDPSVLDQVNNPLGIGRLPPGSTLALKPVNGQGPAVVIRSSQFVPMLPQYPIPPRDLSATPAAVPVTSNRKSNNFKPHQPLHQQHQHQQQQLYQQYHSVAAATTPNGNNGTLSNGGDHGYEECKVPVLAKSRAEIASCGTSLLRPEAAAHKVHNASRKPKDKVVEELWQHYLKCHKQDLSVAVNSNHVNLGVAAAAAGAGPFRAKMYNPRHHQQTLQPYPKRPAVVPGDVTGGQWVGAVNDDDDN